MNQNQKAVSMLWKMQKSKQVTKAIATSLSNKLKPESIDVFEKEIKQKITEKIQPSKCLHRPTLNHFVYQAFIVNGILSDRDKSLHQTNQTDIFKQDFIKRIQARYEAVKTPRLPSGEKNTTPKDGRSNWRQTTKNLQDFFSGEVKKYSKRKSQQRKIYPVLLEN